MPLHLLAGAGSVTNGSTFAQVGRLVDNYFTSVNDGYQQTKSHKVFAAYVRGPNVTDARVNAPLLRIPFYPRVSLLDTAAAPPNLPPVDEYEGNGYTLAPLDPLNVEVSRAGADAQVCQYALWVSPTGYTPSLGQSRTVKATTVVTGSLTAWTQASLSFESVLPPGRYQIVGAMGYGTGLLFGRFIFPDTQIRPGFLAQQTVDEYSWNWFRHGRMGVWGEFDQQAVPSIEFLHYAAGTNPTVLLDLVKVA